MEKGKRKSNKYLFEQTKKFRFNKIIRDKRFLKAHKDLIKRIKGLNENDKLFRTFLFSLNWGISWKVNPRKNYKENNRMLRTEMLFPPPVSLEFELPILDCNLKGTFQIDLGYPDRAIFASFQEQLKIYRDIYKKKLKGKVGRSRFYEFKRYLKVYKLHEDGESWNSLANRFYKDEDLNYRKQKVKRDYFRGKKIAESRYRQIR